MKVFMDIASTEAYKDHVGAIFGMATAYMILKQVNELCLNNLTTELGFKKMLSNLYVMDF